MAITLGSAFAAYIEGILSRGATIATTPVGFRFKSSGGATLCDISVSNTDFNSSGALVAAVSGTATANADGATAATVFELLDSDQNVMFEGTVGTSGADINFDDNVWTNGGVVTLNSFQFSQPLS